MPVYDVFANNGSVNLSIFTLSVNFIRLIDNSSAVFDLHTT